MEREIDEAARDARWTMTVMNVSLPEELKAFIDSQVERAGYSTPEEYVRALLNEAREREDYRRDVRAKLLEAVEDDPIPMSDDDWDQVRAELDRRAAARREDGRGASQASCRGSRFAWQTRRGSASPRS